MKRLEKFKNAILYVSDLIIFLLIAVWVIACIFTAICAVYDLTVNGSSETMGHFTAIVGLPFGAGLVVYSARCAITHFFKNKNGEVPNPDFADDVTFNTCNETFDTEEVVINDIGNNY